MPGSLTELQLLKLRLMESGITISDAAKRYIFERVGAQPLTLADYASTSGITLVLGDNVWVNAPTSSYNPNFVLDPDYELVVVNNALSVRGRNCEAPAKFVPVPDYHDKTNRWGEHYTSYAYTHTDRVRISPIEGCSFTCQFCDLPHEYKYRKKRIEGLTDSIARSVKDSVLPAYHVLISGGVPRPEDYDYLQEVYRVVTRTFRDLAIDVMMTPAMGLLDIDDLHKSGVNQLSINLEIYNEDIASRLMPRKHDIGRGGYLSFIESAVERFGRGGVRSLLMVGVEPFEDTLAGVRALAERGCEPVLSPFRPDPSTPMRNNLPPKATFMEEVYLRSRDIAEKYNVKLGPHCIPCMHNTISFPDDSDYYHYHGYPPTI